MTGLAIAAVACGAAFTVGGVALVVRTAGAIRVLRAFPRSRKASWVLSAVCLIWSGWLLFQAPLGFLSGLKPLLPVLVPASIFLVCRYLDELLAPRALGGLLVLVPAPMLEAARWHASPLSIVVKLLAYAFVLIGMILLFSPYLFRKSSAVLVRTDVRARITGAVCACAGVFLLALAIFVY